MKKNSIPILDVDFIGDQEQPITTAEQKVVSDYFQKQKNSKRSKK
jgi:hypothetical protein